MLGDVDTFSVTFPPTASPKDKALFLGALMLVDFLYFEKKNSGAMNDAAAVGGI